MTLSDGGGVTLVGGLVFMFLRESVGLTSTTRATF